jgi:beta-lactamase class A
VVQDEANAAPSLNTLKDAVAQIMQQRQFTGVTMVHVINLTTGEEQYFGVDTRQGSPQYITCDVALAGQSVMKIAIMVDFFRTVGIPEAGSDNEKILHQTMIESGDVSANFMLQVIGDGNATRGAEDVTQMMQNLGMKNSFIVVPYGDKTPAEKVAYFSTPAREAARDGTCINTLPDYAMQTTVSDLAIIMDMIYQCSDYGGGGLLAAYPNSLTQETCQEMVKLMEQNPDGIIMAGIPQDVPIAHKHGWGSVDTITDSAIVYSPAGPYIVAYGLWVPDASWVDPNRTFPLLAQVSEVLFNFYNPDLIGTPRQGFNPVLNIQP